MIHYIGTEQWPTYLIWRLLFISILTNNEYTYIENSSRARTYRLVCSFSLNSYLKCVKIEKFKFALCRFKVSAHRLAVEAGRWHKLNKIPYNERKCQLCNTLEDEFHFLLECPLYYDLRKALIDK